MIKFNIATDDEGNSAISIYGDGLTTVVTEDHPNFSRIATALVNKEDVTQFLDLSSLVDGIDDRVAIVGNTVYFDGEPVHNKLTSTILRYHREGRDYGGLVRFMERLAENPSARGREVIFEWIQNRDLTITPDGTFIGWKGVGQDLLSVHSGKAQVDGVETVGRIPNEVGSVISMPRTHVMDDPNVDCHQGLHVGTYEYARNFGAVLLEVEVGPEDVVSVPASDTSWKFRCCKYTVLTVHNDKNDEAWEQDYEAEATEVDADPGIDSLEVVIPATFMEKLRSKWRKN